VIVASFRMTANRINTPNFRNVTLGRVPGQARFSSMHEYPENIPVPRMIIVTAHAGIFYANAGSVKEHIMELVRNSAEPVLSVVLDIGLTGNLDLGGAEMLSELHQELRKIGISLRLSRVRDSPQEMLGRMEITAHIGEEHFHAVPLLAAAEYIAEEGLGHRMACDILPDMVRYVMNMVRERASLVTGDERVRLDGIGAKLEEILIGLANIPPAQP
jgi:MFS superfamily sulfate permease-like transporter